MHDRTGAHISDLVAIQYIPQPILVVPLLSVVDYSFAIMSGYPTNRRLIKTVKRGDLDEYLRLRWSVDFDKHVATGVTIPPVQALDLEGLDL